MYTYTFTCTCTCNDTNTCTWTCIALYWFDLGHVLIVTVHVQVQVQVHVHVHVHVITVPDFSALAILPRNIFINHSKEYWYMGSILAYNSWKENSKIQILQVILELQHCMHNKWNVTCTK